MKEFWDQRYQDTVYAYGTTPNVFFKESLNKLTTPGRILMVAEGEGRNAVYASKQGWKVDAFDQSEQAKQKAMELASKQGVQFDYFVGTMESLPYAANSFDAIVFIYAHFTPSKQREYHQQLASYLKVGGVLIFEGFEQQHVQNQQNNPKAGGPKSSDMLYDLAQLKADFTNFEFSVAEVVQTVLNEGVYHNGLADVVRLIGYKR